MNKVFIIVLLAILSTTAHAQINSDSLWSIWNDKSAADTSRFKAMDDLTFKHYYMALGQFDSVFYYGQLMLDQAKKKGFKKYQANALHNMAISRQNKVSSDESLDLNSQSLALREEIGDKKGIGRSLANIGGIYSRRNNKFSALDHYKKALVYFEDIDDPGLISHALNSIGGIYVEMSDFPEAIKYMSRSLSVIEESGDANFLTNSLVSLAGMYGRVNDNDKAKEYLTRAYKSAQITKNRNSELQSLYGLGSIFSSEGNYNEAFAYCDSILSRGNESDGDSYMVNLYFANHLRANTYLLMEEYDNALKFFTISNKMRESFSGRSSALSHAMQLGRIYVLKEDGKNGVKWCEEALELAQNRNSLESQASACKCLYESYKILNNGTKALKYHERFLTINDTLNKDEAGKKLQQMEFAKLVLADSLATEEEKRLVEEAHQEEIRQKNQTRNMLLGGGLLLTILAGGIYSRLRYTRKAKAIIEKEKDRSENLLLNILPSEIAEELKLKGKADARDFNMVSILFTDFKGFTIASEKLSAQDLVSEINTCFEVFDGIMGKYKIEKIKTIGDAYMAAGGLPVPSEDSIKNTVLAALEMQAFISKRKVELNAQDKPSFEMRAGIHTGPVVAGIVGVKKFQYDIWGDTVNTASRMESNGEVGKVNISSSTYELLKDDTDFVFESRGKIQAKGKGEIEMYYVERA